MNHIVTAEDLVVDVQDTVLSRWVDVDVPMEFDLECEACYSALNDVLAPYGGTAEAESIYRETLTLVMVRYLV